MLLRKSNGVTAYFISYITVTMLLVTDLWVISMYKRMALDDKIKD